MSNLLERASVVLTPTGFNNGEALCIKPEDGSGDFDFSRNSAATRVNAQGLVEDVQILSSNLVQNGDFSEQGAEEVSNGSFSQQGSELVTNGDFATDSDWLKSNSTISSGKGNLNGDGQTSMLWQNILTQNKFYKATFTISNYNNLGQSILMNADGTAYFTITENATFTVYFKHTVSNGNLYFRAINGAVYSIDNVSCVEVGQDWVFGGSGWSIGEDKLVSVNGSNFGVYQLGALVSGKTYKITYEVKDYVSGQFGIRANTVGGLTVTANGVYTDYLTSNGELVYLLGYANFNGSVTNISFKEVGQNWTLGTGWSIGDNKAISDASTNSYLNQQVYEIGKKYKLNFEVLEGTIELRSAQYSKGTGFYTTGTYSIEVIPTTISTHFYVYTGFGQSSITNISLIEITDDTNLPRINYEGFSYQDALGSELVLNGDFSNGSANWTIGGSGFDISNGKLNLTNALLYATSARNSQNVVSGKTYLVEYTISDYVSGSSQIRLGNQFGTSRNSNGTFSEYIVADDTLIRLYPSSNNTTLSIDNVSVKEVLGQEVVPDSGCGHWLWENQSTNLVTYSEDFSTWTNGTTYTTQNYSISPDGTQNASRCLFTNVNQGIINTTSLASGVECTASVYVKGVENETILLASGGVDSIHTLNGNWQRIQATKTSVNSTIIIGTFGGATARDIEIWGAQLEQQSYATSYIPSNGTQTTRNQDVCTNGGSVSTINSTEGVLYAEIAALVNDGTLRMVNINDGTQNNRVGIQYSSTTNLITAAYDISGAGQATLNYTLSDANSFNKIAFKFALNDFSLFVNGVKVATDTSGNVLPPNTLNNIDFDYGDNRFYFYGKTKCLAVWKEALSDEELTLLTTI